MPVNQVARVVHGGPLLAGTGRRRESRGATFFRRPTDAGTIPPARFLHEALP